MKLEIENSQSQSISTRLTNFVRLLITFLIIVNRLIYLSKKVLNYILNTDI